MVGAHITIDYRVKRLLDWLELKYQIDDDCDFRLSFSTGDGRFQDVFICSSTNELHNIEIRDIYSAGYESDGVLPEKVANRLLERNWKLKLGAWAKWGSTQYLSQKLMQMQM